MTTKPNRRVLAMLAAVALTAAACGGKEPAEPRGESVPGESVRPAVQAGGSDEALTDANPSGPARDAGFAEVNDDAPALPTPNVELRVSLFDYELTLGKGTFEEGRVYGRPMVMLAPASLEERIRRSDAVLVVDVVKIGEPTLNSTDDLWWPPLHVEDPTVLRPQVGFDVEVQLVSVLKARERATTYAFDYPNEADRSNFGAVHSAREVAELPRPGDTFNLWVDGGFAVVTVTAEAWNTYVDEWSSPPSIHVHIDGDTEVDPENVPAVFTMDYGGLPGMDLSEGGRYIVFLTVAEVPYRDGTVRRVWTGGYSTNRAQLLLDPSTGLLVASKGSDQFTVDDFATAFNSALDSDVSASEYNPGALDGFADPTP